MVSNYAITSIRYETIPLPQVERELVEQSRGERESADEARRASLYFGDLLHQLMTARIRVHDLDEPWMAEHPGSS